MNKSPELLAGYMSILSTDLTGYKGITSGITDYQLLQRFNCGLDSDRMSFTMPADNKADTTQDVMSYMRELGFVGGHLESKDEYVCILMEKDYPCCQVIARLLIQEGKVRMSLGGDPKKLAELEERFATKYPARGSFVTTVLSYDAVGKARRTYDFLIPEKVNLALPSFYPFLHKPMKEYFEAYMDSSSSVLLLIGPPGTGKSTFLRTLILSGKYSAHLAYSAEALGQQKLVDDFYVSDSQILGMEDVDNYIGRREAGNTQMSSFLNITEGVVPRKKKIVFSTNLSSVNKVDPALLRPGRCYDVLEFRLLTPVEAYAVAAAMNMPERDYYSREQWALSEVLNPVTEGDQEWRTRTRVGFI